MHDPLIVSLAHIIHTHTHTHTHIIHTHSHTHSHIIHTHTPTYPPTPTLTPTHTHPPCGDTKQCPFGGREGAHSQLWCRLFRATSSIYSDSDSRRDFEALWEGPYLPCSPSDHPSEREKGEEERKRGRRKKRVEEKRYEA